MDSSSENEEFERQIVDLDKKLRILEFNLSQQSQDTIKDSLTPHQTRMEYVSEQEEDYDECTLELPFMKNFGAKIEPLVGSLGIPSNITGLNLQDYTDDDFIDYDEYNTDSEDSSSDDEQCTESINYTLRPRDDDDSDDEGDFKSGQPSSSNTLKKSMHTTSNNDTTEHVRYHSGNFDGKGYKANRLSILINTRPLTMPASYKQLDTVPVVREKRWSNYAMERIGELDFNQQSLKRDSILTPQSISIKGGFFIAMQDYMPDDCDYIKLLHGDLIKMKSDWGVNLHTLEQGKINSDYLLSVTSEVVIEMLTRMNISEVVLKDIEGLVDGFDSYSSASSEISVMEDIIKSKPSKNFKSTHCIQSDPPTIFFCWNGKCDRVAVYGSFNNYEKVVPLFFDSSSKVYVAFCESFQPNGDVCYFRFLVDDSWRIDDIIPSEIINGEIYNCLVMNCGEIQAKKVVIKREPVRFKVLPRMILLEQEVDGCELIIDSSEIDKAIWELGTGVDPFEKHLRIDSGISMASKLNGEDFGLSSAISSMSTSAIYSCYSYNCANLGNCYSISCNRVEREIPSIAKQERRPSTIYIPNEVEFDSNEDDFFNSRHSISRPVVSPSNSSNESDYDCEFPHHEITYFVEDYIKEVDPSYNVFDKLSELGNISDIPDLQLSESSVELEENVDWYSPTFSGQNNQVDNDFQLDTCNLFLLDDPLHGESEYWDTTESCQRVTAEEVRVNLRLRQPSYPAMYVVKSYRPIILSPVLEYSEYPPSPFSATLEPFDDYEALPTMKITTQNIDTPEYNDEMTPKATDYTPFSDSSSSSFHHSFTRTRQIPSPRSFDTDSEIDYEYDEDIQPISLLFDSNNLGSKSIIVLLALIPYFHFYVSSNFIPLVFYITKIMIYCQIANFYAFIINETIHNY